MNSPLYLLGVAQKKIPHNIGKILKEAGLGKLVFLSLYSYGQVWLQALE